MTEPCTLVIFGSTGNLARNKLLPALYHLEAADRVHEKTRIIGFGRRRSTVRGDALRQGESPGGPSRGGVPVSREPGSARASRAALGDDACGRIERVALGRQPRRARRASRTAAGPVGGRAHRIRL